MSAAAVKLSAGVMGRVKGLPVPGWDGGAVMAGVLSPTVRVGACAWVEANVVLGARLSSEPGRISLDRIPYAREILEAAADPEVRVIDLMSSTQVAKTTILHCITARAVDVDPGPMLWLLADEKAAREMADEKLLPLFEDSPALRKHLPKGRGISAYRHRLDTMDIHYGWPRSPMVLASKPKRYVIADEVDKYPLQSGKEADPTELAAERQRTYKTASLMVRSSTPTDHEGKIYRGYSKSDRRTFRVPCPRCGKYERLLWQQVRWPGCKHDTSESQLRRPLPSEIKAKRLAWYECPQCKGRIEESERWGMVMRGVWCPEGLEVVDGKIDGEVPAGDHRGYWWWAAYSPWLTFSEIVAKWLSVQGDPFERQNFINSWLAELWRHETKKHDAGKLELLKRDYRFGEIPESASVLTCGVDKQKGHLWFVVRAFDAMGNSWLIECGRFDRLEDEKGRVTNEFSFLENAVRRRGWVAIDGSRVDLVAGFVDSRYDGDLVFSWVRKNQPLFSASQGSETELHQPLRKVTFDPQKGRGKNVKYQLDYWRVNTEFFKDSIAEEIADVRGFYVPGVLESEGDRQKFAEYEAQLFSEHKALEKGKKQDKWMLRPGQRDNHLWDCEVLAKAAAFKAGVGAMGGRLPRAPGAVVKTGEWKKGIAEKRKQRNR